MQNKKPASLTRIVIISLSCVLIAWATFWYCTHDFVTSYIKYIGYTVTLIFAIYKEIIKQDETTKKWEIQPPSGWIVPIIVFFIICFVSVSSDVSDARDKKQTSKNEAAQRQIEKANHRAETSDLKRELAELKLSEAVSQEQSKRYQSEQVELAKRSRLEDQRQNEATRHEVIEKAIDQKNLITQKNIADVQRSVQDLKAIQSGFQKNEKGFVVTGQAISRSVNRIEKIGLSYQLMLPLWHSDMKTYRAQLDNTMHAFLSKLPQEKTNDPAFVGLVREGGVYPAINKKVFIDARVEILPSSPMYPSNFDSRFERLLSYPLHLKINRKIAKRSPYTHPSDLNVQVGPGSTYKLYYYPQDKSLRLVSMYTEASITKTNGYLWSLLDLDGSKVEVRRNNFDYTTNNYFGEPLTSLQKGIILTEIILIVNDTAFIYNGKTLTIGLDTTGAFYTSFIFDLAEGRRQMNSFGPAGYF